MQFRRITRNFIKDEENLKAKRIDKKKGQLISPRG